MQRLISKVNRIIRGIVFSKQYRISVFRNRVKELEECKSQQSLNTEYRDTKIIVSLTSFPARFDNLHFVIQSILAQTMKVDRINLYLDDNVSIDDVPDALKILQDEGMLSLYFRGADIKPHKKYYYAILENPEEMIITVDDDIIYPPELVETLYKTHLKFPDCVVATRGHKILFYSNGMVRPYNDWFWEYSVKDKPGKDLIACGTGGVLYPPHCMDNGLLLRLDLIDQLSKYNDDLWLKAVQIVSGTKVVFTDRRIRDKRVAIHDTQNITLNSSNVGANKNDIYIANLFEYFQFDKSSFTD